MRSLAAALLSLIASSCGLLSDLHAPDSLLDTLRHVDASLREYTADVVDYYRMADPVREPRMLEASDELEAEFLRVTADYLNHGELDLNRVRRLFSESREAYLGDVAADDQVTVASRARRLATAEILDAGLRRLFRLVEAAGAARVEQLPLSDDGALWSAP